MVSVCFFFQAEDGIRGAQESRGLGDVYKRQVQKSGIISEVLIYSNKIKGVNFSVAVYIA